MTMHVYFNEDKDGYKAGWSGYVERSLACRFCDRGIATPYQKHLDNLYNEAQTVVEPEPEVVKPEPVKPPATKRKRTNK